MSHLDVAIIGAGPAGLMAAARAAERGRKTILLDKNREPGVKILISGGGRCNLTHATDARGIVAAFGRNGRFLHSALAALGPQQVVDLFEAEGVPIKIEPDGKMFPASDRAADVRDALLRRAERAGCTLAMEEPLVELISIDRADIPVCHQASSQHGRQECLPHRQLHSIGFQLQTTKRSIEAEKVVLASGGKSYPDCGTTGDGYRWAAALGHHIVPPHAGLAPITSHAGWVLDLQGITLADVAVEVIEVTEEADKNVCPTGKPLAIWRGPLLFAHFGVSGPVVLNISHAVSGYPRPASLRLRCDLLPTLTERELDDLLAGEQAAAGKRHAASLLDPWLPHRVGETVVMLSGTPPDRPLGELSKAQRRRVVQTVKRLDIPVAGTMGFHKAEVTAGGVSLDEVDSRTMQSKIVRNLYFAGELLDLNGPEGGYNIQAAFSTGWLAGENV
ncbi:MAG: NAD(P)/FAD-dependent oxidoreductase [Thermoguttaceae bacterium]